MKIALIGYGKMGKAIEAIAIQKGIDIVLKSNNHDDLQISSDIKDADVAIEFTQASAAVENILFCFKHGVPVVCGTTGWLNDFNIIEDAVKKYNAGFIYASNFSIGVNIFFELNKRLASLMSSQEQYDVNISETHHIHKKDAPSGTAITLAEQIIDSGKKKNWIPGESESNSSLGISSYRMEEVPGSHEIKYFCSDDSITIRHDAYNRNGFAAGALEAAIFLKGKKGLYTMKDVLKL